MANSDIRAFRFYKNYIWQPGDFDDMQRWVRDEMRDNVEGLTAGGILAGLDVTNVGGMTLQVNPGIATSPTGRVVVVGAAVQATAASDPSFDRRSIFVLRPKLTASDLIPNPLDPLTLVPLHDKLEYDLLVIPGTPSATPSYPALGAEDIPVMGVLIPAGAVTLSSTNFEITQRKAPKSPRRQIREVSTAYLAASGEGVDDIIEYDATAASGLVSLPPASLMIGRSITVMKVDSSANEVVVKPDGSETLSGQAQISLDSQWMKITAYAHKSSWRIL